jgi:8-oxo-dGTP pyrophosphatase MutT (NUDIX family)
MKKSPWKIINSKIKYKNPWLKVREYNIRRPDGQKGIYGVVEKSPGVFIIAFENNSIYLLKQYRFPLKKYILELPGGTFNGKNSLFNAKRELFEETGIKAKTWKYLGKFYTGAGHETTYVKCFIAKNLNISKLQTEFQDGNEYITQIINVKIPKLKKMLKENKIECGISAAALNLFFLHLK